VRASVDPSGRSLLSTSSGDDEVRPALTEREHRVLTQVVSGLSNHQIAEQLGTGSCPPS